MVESPQGISIVNLPFEFPLVSSAVDSKKTNVHVDADGYPMIEHLACPKLSGNDLKVSEQFVTTIQDVV